MYCAQGCLAQKRQFLPSNMLSWAHIGLAGSFGALLVGWSGCGARAVSRKTPIYLITLLELQYIAQLSQPAYH